MIDTFKTFLTQRHYEQFFEKIFSFNDTSNDEYDLIQDEKEERLIQIREELIDKILPD